MEELNNIIEDLRTKIAEFSVNLDLNAAGNKAAGARARKNSLELEKMLKEYRKLSVAAGK